MDDDSNLLHDAVFGRAGLQPCRPRDLFWLALAAEVVSRAVKSVGLCKQVLEMRSEIRHPSQTAPASSSL